MFRGSNRSAGTDEASVDVGARPRRDRLLLVAIGLLVPALVVGPGLLAPGPEGLAPAMDPGGHVARDAGEASVSSSGWHPGIEHGLGPIGPAPGDAFGRAGD
jgi:hypothetical protein